MHPVEHEKPSPAFVKAWQAAGHHLQKQGQEGINWVRADLNPPMAEHLSFRIGNQLIFIFVEAAEFNFQQNPESFLKAAKVATAIPCILTMTGQLSEYTPASSGWGLVHAETGKAVNPLELVTDELIQISDWELHDFAIQVVKESLKKAGKNVFSAQSSLTIDPSIWFEESGHAYWVVVRATRYPEPETQTPSNIDDIKDNCSPMGKAGYFASVSAGNSEDPFDPKAKQSKNTLPLYRGHPMFIKYEGLKEI
ncbi:MAG: hypothetical protein GY744_00960 [Gammaproteobacteria bacterium]|nr:hypothetical protein [Gammaproteobacteria bacterium]